MFPKKINYYYGEKLLLILGQNKKDLIDSVSKELLKEDDLYNISNSRQLYISKLRKLLIINNSIFRTIKFNIIKKNVNRITSKKIKAIFICHEFQTFPSFMSVYDEMKKNDLFDCKLLYVPFSHPNREFDYSEIKAYEKNGYSEIVNSKDYNIYEESPDICFYLKPYDVIDKKYYINNIRNIVPYIVYIPYGMEIGSTEESIKYQYQLELHDIANICVSYCKFNYDRAIKYSSQKGKNYYLLGHPRMDLIKYDFSNNCNFIRIKKLIKSRYTFMLNCHFTIDDKEDNWGTFLYYGMDVLKYFSKHKELFLIYRPHPFLLASLEKEWKNHPEKLKEYNKLLSENKDNIYYDNGSNYLIGFHLSNALISDAASFIPEYLSYGKPVIYTKKPNTTGFGNKKLEKLTYICNNSTHIIKFANDIVNNKDSLKDFRDKNTNQVLQIDDKELVANKIINIILKDFGELNERKDSNN